MHSISWDRDDIGRQFDPTQSFKELVESIEKECWSKGHVVCEIELNGQKLTEEDELRLAESRLDSIDALEVYIEPIDNVLTRTFLELEKWSATAKVFMREIASYYTDGQPKRAHQRFSELMTGLEWFINTVYLIKGSIRNSRGAQALPKTLANREAQFQILVTQMIKFFEEEDSVAIVDLLEYELPEQVDKWLEELSGCVNIDM